jgi:hypothetical protein
LALT